VNGRKTTWDACGGGSRGLFQGLWHCYVCKYWQNRDKRNSVLVASVWGRISIWDIQKKEKFGHSKNFESACPASFAIIHQLSLYLIMYKASSWDGVDKQPRNLCVQHLNEILERVQTKVEPVIRLQTHSQSRIALLGYYAASIGKFLTDVSGQPNGPIFKRKESEKCSSLVDCICNCL
jgi:hypothetical protein